MKLKLIIAGGLICIVAGQSFIISHDGDEEAELPLHSRLSDYHIYTGKASDLLPSNGFIKYELATPFFSNYAEKERLLKIPAGEKFIAHSDGLPHFPHATILVKTFFYWNDKRDTSKGKRIIETRILLKTKEGWLAGTYAWNAHQTEAVLINSGLKENISWIDESGTGKNIKYRVPSVKQCGSCHNSGGVLNPLGFKIRNLNINVTRSRIVTNQLKYFMSMQIMNTVELSSFSTLPAWNSNLYTPEQREQGHTWK
jgi:hypothetical protein